MPTIDKIQVGGMGAPCSGFTVRLLTRCRTPLIAGGLCEVGYEAQSRRDLQNLTTIEFDEADSICDIDYKLAKAVRESCGKYVWAIGVTASLPMPIADFNLANNVTIDTTTSTCSDTTVYAVHGGNATNALSTGGIIGSPHMEIASATTQVEHIGNGLIMRAFPGGPGCVAMCDDTNILASFDANAYKQTDKAKALATHLRKQNVETFFIVTDGTGQDAAGMFILQTQTEQITLSF